MTGKSAPPPTIAGLEAWLVESAWPLWRDHGVDRQRGGFHETLNPATLTCPAQFRRLRVLTRQIYVFSCAAQRGLPGADELVAFGLDILQQSARQPDGGYAWRLGLDGSVTDQRRDLYDHGFVLLALASAASIVPGAHLRAEAHRLMAWLDASMRHPCGGYSEAWPRSDEPRRQNSHMHLLEAVLAAWGAFGDDLFLDRADELVGLFLDRLFDPATGTLCEFFSENWSALPFAGAGNQIEPGHHAEWIGLLDWHRRSCLAAGRRAPERSQVAVTALRRFAERFGVHRDHGAFVDAVAIDGSVMSAGARLWPQTERLKSAALNLTKNPQGLDRAVAALAPYLDHPVTGLWHERRTTDGNFAVEPVPASSLYHLTSGILFAARLAIPPESKRPGSSPAFDDVDCVALRRDARSPTSRPRPCRSPAKP